MWENNSAIQQKPQTNHFSASIRFIAAAFMNPAFNLIMT